MSPFPSAEKELAELERFLASVPPSAQALDAAFLDLKRRAERVALRIANPVRVAIVGLPGAGKSMLTSFLIGEEFGEARAPDGGPLPVILRFGERPQAFASWWSGIDVPLLGVDISIAADHNPDYVELRLGNPVLQFLSFLDMPGRSTWEAQKEQVRWVASRADILIWCAEATTGWTDDERQLWALVPKRLQAQSILAMIHDHVPPPETPLGPLGDTEVVGGKAQFHDVIGIATQAALAASPKGRVQDSELWDRAGGKALVGALLGVARLARRNDIVLAREILNRLTAQSADPAIETEAEAEAAELPSDPVVVTPSRPRGRTREFLELTKPMDDEAAARQEEAEAPVPPEEPVTTQDDAPTPPPASVPPTSDPAATEAAPSRLLRQFAEGLDSLAAYTSDNPEFKDWEFMAKVTELCETLSETTSARGALRQEADWVGREIEDAFIALSLMQLEQGEQPCRDAATVLLQLARDLAWADAAAAAEAA